MSRILLNRIYYPVTVLGYGRRLGVWVQGCHRGCSGCISPETWPTEGALIEVGELTARMPKDIRPDGLTVSGGEPFEQTEAVAELVRWYIDIYNDDVLIYTGYGLAELKKRKDVFTGWLLDHVAALVDGSYIEEQNTGRGCMGSANQTLHVFRHAERYEDFAARTRSLQCVQESGRLFFIGIPPKEKEI